VYCNFLIDAAGLISNLRLSQSVMSLVFPVKDLALLSKEYGVQQSIMPVSHTHGETIYKDIYGLHVRCLKLLSGT